MKTTLITNAISIPVIIGNIYKVSAYELNRRTVHFKGKFDSWYNAGGRPVLRFVEVGEGNYKYTLRADDVISIEAQRSLPIPSQSNYPDAGADTKDTQGLRRSDASTKRSASEVNVGNSDYATRTIQPWDIWEEYSLNPWDADIVKRVLRTKKDGSMSATKQRILDYQKIQHVCAKRIEMLTKGK